MIGSLAIALTVTLLAPAGAAALTGPQVLTFGDYPEGTEISTQYEGQGILFDEEDGLYPEIRWDESAYTNPVLSGTFGFGSTIGARFVAPGTTTPEAVENLSMDVGYINEPGSTVLTVERTSGPTTIFAGEEGFNHLSLAAGDITGFTVESVGGEPAGWTLDNLGYTIPTPPSPPPPPPPAPAAAAAPAAPSCPTYEIFDTRGSGEPDEISKPGNKFMIGFLQRLRALKKPSSVSLHANPYPAVGVVSWDHWSQDLNFLGALFGVHQLGAYHDSEEEGRKEVRSFVETEIAGACGSRSKIILLGYSQGAQGTGDAYSALNLAQRDHIAAVVLWGDPLYNHTDDPADRDASLPSDGSLGTRKPFPNDAKRGQGSRVFSYCNEHDPICQEDMLWPQNRALLLHYRTKEHSLYYTTDESKNDGSAVASYLAGGGG
ncbi:MAG: cutinase family protein [Actinobacteria bacterium]|nr:cutinase family protein [Actinomycetota bacterium]